MFFIYLLSFPKMTWLSASTCVGVRENNVLCEARAICGM